MSASRGGTLQKRFLRDGAVEDYTRPVHSVVREWLLVLEKGKKINSVRARRICKS